MPSVRAERFPPAISRSKQNKKMTGDRATTNRAQGKLPRENCPKRQKGRASPVWVTGQAPPPPHQCPLLRHHHGVSSWHRGSLPGAPSPSTPRASRPVSHQPDLLGVPRLGADSLQGGHSGGTQIPPRPSRLSLSASPQPCKTPQCRLMDAHTHTPEMPPIG